MNIFVDYERDVVWCGACDRGAKRGTIFQHFGFRLVVRCECGADVATGLCAEDLPYFEIDFAGLKAMSVAARAAMGPPGTWVERYPGILIDSDTPIWAVKPRPIPVRMAA
jgi:hypothetical protein